MTPPLDESPAGHKPAIDGALEHQERSEKQWRIFDATLSSITDFAYTFDREGRFLYANQPLLDLWGLTLEEAVGKNFFDLQYPEELAARLHQQIRQVFATGERVTDETPYVSPTGVVGHYEYIFCPVIGVDGAIELVAGSTRDVTQRKQAESALVKSEKLAAAGRLAATLAHEINNPLQAVMNLITLLSQSPRLDAQDKGYATRAEQELRRVVHLTQQSLGFYREAVFPKPVDPGEVIESILDLYSKQINARQIHVIGKYPSSPVSIHSYPGEIRQVFSTLLVNAMEALPEGGSIVIRVRSSRDARNRENDGVRVTIADSGVGIPTHNTAHIFEPFFTTKGEHGTGLGLWVAHGIIMRLGGSIRVRSNANPGQSGTCFSIFLPSRAQRNP